MDVHLAIEAAEQLLPGVAAPEGEIDPRWQAIIAVGEFIEDEPEAVWQFVQRWGVSPDESLRAAVATCLLEHLLEYRFETFMPRVEALVSRDRWFAATFGICSKFGQSETARHSRRFDALQNLGRALSRASRTVIVRSKLDAATFGDFSRQFGTVRTIVESGDSSDLSALTKSLGGDLGWLLGDLFGSHALTAKCGTDGVILGTAALKGGRLLVLTGTVWCVRAGHQWEVPCEIACCFSADRERTLLTFDISVGNIDLQSLEAHDGRSVVKAANLNEWLVTFEVEPPAPSSRT